MAHFMQSRSIYDVDKHIVPLTIPSLSSTTGSNSTRGNMDAIYNSSHTQQALHFLTLPIEIREAIWRSMLQLISAKRESYWFQKPKIEFAALQLTCRQLYREIEIFRPQLLITFDKYSRFHKALFADLELNFCVNIKKFRSLTIEFRLDADLVSVKTLSKGLQILGLSLEELNLSFTGTDGYGTCSYLHGCAYSPESEGRIRLLPPSGQIPACEMVDVLRAIMGMRQLRILVMSNLNFPLLARIFQNKPKLEYLHITADPRSAVHTINLNTLGVMAVPGTSYYPPVKVMQICTNSMYNAFALPSTCALTLRHLTWTIPDPSLNSNMIDRQVYESTDQLIRNLALNAKKLTTLRICVQGESLTGRQHLHHVLASALTSSLAMISTLKELEIHMVNNNCHFGWDLLSSLPSGLQRFYASDELIRPRDLYNFVTEKFLAQDLTPFIQQRVDPVEERLARWSPQPPLAASCEYSYSECSQRNFEKDEFVNMWIEHGNCVTALHDKNIASIELPLCTDADQKWFKALFLPGIIGENYRRKDYVPLRTGELKFVSYQFRDPEYVCQTVGTGETLTHMVLRLNGRLLDRERNQHLAMYGNAKTIPPYLSTAKISDTQHETQYRSENQNISLLLHDLHAIEYERPRDVKAALADLRESQFTNDTRYFGNEDDAYAIFEREIPADMQDLDPITYQCIVECDSGHGDQCDWVCPEASVPTLAEFDSVRAWQRALAKQHGLES